MRKTILVIVLCILASITMVTSFQVLEPSSNKSDLDKENGKPMKKISELFLTLLFKFEISEF